MAELTAQDAQALIHRGQTETEAEPIEYEADDFANMDAFTEEDLPPEMPPAALEEPAPETPPATEAIDWQALAQQQTAEIARLKAEREAREKADFERFIDSKPPEERYEAYKAHVAEQERAREVAALREEQARTHPLANAFFSPVMERFDMEIEDPAALAEAYDALERTYAGIINQVVEARLKQEMDKFYAETGREWGVRGLGSAQPRPLAPANPVRNQYERTHQELAKPGKVKTQEQLTDLIRHRQQAKTSR